MAVAVAVTGRWTHWRCVVVAVRTADVRTLSPCVRACLCLWSLRYERTWPVYNGTVVNASHTVAAGSSLADGGAQSAGVCATAAQLQPDPTVPLDVFVDPQAPVFVVQGTAGAMQHSTSVAQTDGDQWRCNGQQRGRWDPEADAVAFVGVSAAHCPDC